MFLATNKVNFAEMCTTRRRSHKREAEDGEVPISGANSYSVVAETAATSLQLDPPGEPYELKIFRCNESVVSDAPIPTAFEEQPWTWRSYITMIGKHTSRVKFGVGYVYSVSSLGEFNRNMIGLVVSSVVTSATLVLCPFACIYAVAI